MPNKRKDGKKRVAVWLTPDQRKVLAKMIEIGYVSDMSDFIKKSIDDAKKEKGLDK